MVKKTCVISYLLFIVAGTIVVALRETFPRPCAFNSFDGNQRGSCVHQKQCVGPRRPSPDCFSPTGRRLVCCKDYFPKRKYIDTDGVCGVRPALSELKPRDSEMKTSAIVGGVEAWKFSWRWMTAIYERRNFLCGGSLITPNCILTAAHCFDGMNNQPNRFYVRLGEHNLYTDVKDEIPEEIQASTIHVHPKFETNCSDHDIAVIRLKSSSQMTTVCLPPKNTKEHYVGQNGVVAGWGTTKYDSLFKEPFSSYLQEITIPILKPSYCEDHYKSIPEYKKAFKHGLDEKRFICAGTEDGSRDACLGDSGGPLVVELTPNIWSLVGIVTIGYGCGMKGYPGVYTRVSEYLDWAMQFCEN